MNNQWKMVPVEPTPEMYAAASVDSREQGILGAGYKAMLAAAPVPPDGDVEVRPVLWFKPLPGLLAKSSGQCYDVVFAEMPGYQPLYAAPVCPAADRESLRDAIAQAIGGDAYDCTRAWEAWGVGTMSEDDFVSIVDQEERIDEIVEACLGQVTRLTAERDGLQQRLEASDRFYNIDVDHLQSELTKAHECIASVLGLLRADKSSHAQYAILRYQGFPSDWQTATTTNSADESCGQDAEAAKGGDV